VQVLALFMAMSTAYSLIMLFEILSSMPSFQITSWVYVFGSILLCVEWSFTGPSCPLCCPWWG